MHSKQEGMGGGSDGGERALSDACHTGGIEAVGTLTDEELLSGTRRLVCQSNRVLAALLAHLAEVEARGLHRMRACASLFTYCVYELRMSEDAAFRRVGAARLVKRFPELLGAVERGELHLTALLLLGPHLTETNVVEVLAHAKFRTKKEVIKLVRLLSPLPDVPSRIEPLGLERPRVRPTWGNLLAARHPIRELPPDECPSNWLSASDNGAAAPFGASAGPAWPCDARIGEGPVMQSCPAAPARIDQAKECSFEERDARAGTDDSAQRNTHAPARTDGARDVAEECNATISHDISTNADADVVETVDRAAATLSGPQRYSVQFTASEEYVALVAEAKALLAHALPSATLAEVHLRAMRTLVSELKKRRFAVRRQSVESPTGVESPASAAAARATVNGAPAHDATRETKTEPIPLLASVACDDPANCPTSPRQRVRTIPAAVRRSVFERDENRCAFVDSRGVRCRETQRLELHHHEPFARGGPSTAENLSLYCSAHNALAAEQDFGREFSRTEREQGSYFTERTLSLAAASTDERRGLAHASAVRGNHARIRG
jgi:hypothetical protein